MKTIKYIVNLRISFFKFQLLLKTKNFCRINEINTIIQEIKEEFITGKCRKSTKIKTRNISSQD